MMENNDSTPEEVKTDIWDANSTSFRETIEGRSNLDDSMNTDNNNNNNNINRQEEEEDIHQTLKENNYNGQEDDSLCYHQWADERNNNNQIQEETTTTTRDEVTAGNDNSNATASNSRSTVDEERPSKRLKKTTTTTTTSNETSKDDEVDNNNNNKIKDSNNDNDNNRNSTNKRRRGGTATTNDENRNDKSSKTTTRGRRRTTKTSSNSQSNSNNTTTTTTSSSSQMNRIKIATSKMDEIYNQQEEKKQEVNRLTKQLNSALSRLEELSKEYKSAQESVRLAELGESTAWNDMYRKLIEYKEQHGHCRVPTQTNNEPELSALGRWVANQRVVYKHHQEGKPTGTGGVLNAYRIETLNKIGFCWNLYEYKWEQRFEELQEYQRVHGTLNVQGKNNRSLKAWMTTQRTEYRMLLAKRTSSMTNEKIEKLKSIGFNFNTTDNDDNEGIEATTITTYPSSRRKKKSQLPINPSQDELNEQWNKMYQELVAHQQEHGHCNMYKRVDVREGRKSRYVRAANNRLIEFCTQQRKEGRKFQNGESSEMTPERMELLEGIGFSFAYNKFALSERKEGKDLLGITTTTTENRQTTTLGDDDAMNTVTTTDKNIDHDQENNMNGTAI